MSENRTTHEHVKDADAASVSRKKRIAARLFMPGSIALVAFIADRVSKYLIEDFLDMHYAVPVIGDYVRLVLWYNDGAAFGISFGGPMVHVLLSLFALALVTWMTWMTPIHDTLGRVGFGFILGGALGNLYDRIVAGKVTDFIDIGVGYVRWPTFNFADSFVVIGIGLLIIAYFITPSRKKTPAAESIGDTSQVEREESVSQSAN